MKMEFLLSFKNKDKKRNKEYLFSFNYNSILKNYYLIYQREYLILSIECYKDLASLFKKAVRSFSLRDDFFTNIKYSDINNNLIRIKFQKPLITFAKNNFLYNSYRKLFCVMPKYTFINLFNISAGHLSQYNNIDIKTIYPFYFTNYYDDLYLKRDKNDILSLYDDLYLKRDRNDKGYESNSNIFLNDFKDLNIFDIHRANLYIYNTLNDFGDTLFLENIFGKLKLKMFNNFISIYAPNHHRKSMFRFNNIDLSYKDRDGVIRNFQEYLYKTNTNYQITENSNDFFIQNDKIINLYENFYIKSKTNIYSIFKYYLIKPDNRTNILNLYDNISTKSYDKILNSYETVNTYKTVSNYSSLNIFENIFGNTGSLYLNYLKNEYFKTNELKLNSYDNNYAKVLDKLLYLYENDLINKSTNGQLLSSFKIDSFNLLDKKLFLNEIDSFNKTLKYSRIYSNNNFVNTNNSKMIYLQNYNDFINKFNKNTRIYDIYNIDNNIKNIYISNTQSFINKTLNNNKLNQYYQLFIEKHNQIINQLQADNFIINNYKNIYLQINNIFLYKKDFKINIFKNNNFIDKNKSLISLYDKYNSYFIYKDLHLLSIYKTDSFIFKTHKSLFFFENNIFIYKSLKDIEKYNFIDSFKKIYFKIQGVKNDVFIYKMHKDIKYFNKNKNNFIYKIPYDLYKHKEIRSLKLDGKPIFISTDQFFALKIKHKLKLITNLFGIFKECKNLKREDSDYYDVIKYALPLAIINTDDKVIIPLTKIDKSSFCRDAYDFIYKKYKDTNYTNIKEVSVNKIIHDVFSMDQLLCDKLSLNTNFLTLLNDSIIRNKISIYYIDNERFINKLYFNTFLSETINSYGLPREIYESINETITKNINNIFTLENDRIIKNHVQIKNLNTNLITYQKYLKGYEFNSEEWFNVYKLGFIHNNVTIFKIIRDTFNHDKYLDDKEEFLYKIPKNTNQKDFEWQYLEIVKKAFLANSLITNIRNNYQAFYYDNFILSRDIAFGQVPEITEISKCMHEANISSDEIVDWAWVYQDDEGFDDPFKIDELLLPENDTRYEDFEDIIFNRETLKPRNPVKIIDDTTFIAKFPTKYPIKDENDENAYKNIAIDYLEVRTGIMRQVFIGYYKLWQDNIFDFAKMTIQQSSKKILDYLYTWILMYFPEEDMPEALRTFRLIRWYLERSIIECSEYYISYNPDDLTSGKMDNTILDIPNDFNPLPEYIDYMDSDYLPQNTTMFVDTNLHVIRNDPMQLNKEAHTTFFIDNKKNTTISFYLNTYTPVSIILNGEVIDTITLPTTGKMVYNIPYTEDVNVFTISKSADDNLDNYFFIGNIIIKDMGKTGALDISFNPIIKGNKVLNHVSQKMISYMNLYENNETLIQNLRKGNIHLNELYDKLLTYWELHHQEKDKGKRWMIKRT